MTWTQWKKLANYEVYFIDELPDWNGPACYELAIAGSKGGNLKIMYVGETGILKKRLRGYGYDGSHIAGLIQNVVREGKVVFYRYQKKALKKDAKNMQDNLKEKFSYPWNSQ